MLLPVQQMKECNIMINGQNIFDQPVKNDLRTNDNVHKVTTCQGDGYTTGWLLDYLQRTMRIL